MRFPKKSVIESGCWCYKCMIHVSDCEYMYIPRKTARSIPGTRMKMWLTNSQRGGDRTLTFLMF